MNQLYKNQSYIEIVLDTKTDLTNATNCKILVKKDNAVKASWTATKAGTTLKYDVLPNDLDETGIYSLQAYFEVSGRKAFGKPINIQVVENNLS